jgi:hypothetical protein
MPRPNDIMPPAPLFAQVQRNGARSTRIEIN